MSDYTNIICDKLSWNRFAQMAQKQNETANKLYETGKHSLKLKQTCLLNTLPSPPLKQGYPGSQGNHCWYYLKKLDPTNAHIEYEQCTLNTPEV